MSPRGRPRKVLAETSSSSRDAGGALDIKSLETWLWDAACQIRGPLDAPKFKDYILPLIFLKRLSDVFDDDVQRVADEVDGDLHLAKEIIDQDHHLVRFYLPAVSRWPAIALKTTGLGEALTDAVRAVSRQNPRLQGVIDTVDFNATAAGQPIVDNDRLAALVKTLGQHRLGLRDVQPDLLGTAYEYLLRKFAEGQGQSAGEFYTPAEVARLMARILDPQPGMTVYDPCCGSSGLLIKCHLRLLETHGEAVSNHHVLPPEVAPLKLFGQEINPSTFAMSRMNAFIHDMDADIALGDTMRHPAFTDRSGHLRRFDLVIANPMWNQDFPEAVYRNDTMDRFDNGIPPASSADWGWVQHMVASLNPQGRMAIVLDTGAVTRGSGAKGSSRERDIRQALVKADLIEGVILLPENLFYNTPSAGIIMVLNRAKRYPSEILLVNASNLFIKGRPKNELTDSHVTEVGDLFADWKSVAGRCAVVTAEQVSTYDYNLSPARYVTADSIAVLPEIDEAIESLHGAEAEVARTRNELSNELGVARRHFTDEFTGTGNWEEMALGEVFKLTGGKTRPEEFSRTQNDEFQYPIYGGNGILGYAKEYLVETPTVVIGRVGQYCGSAFVTTGKAWISDNALYAKVFLRPVDLRFLTYALIGLNLNQYQAKSAQPLVTQSTIYSLSISLPDIDEQARIASMLDKIAAYQFATSELVSRQDILLRSAIAEIMSKA